MQQPATPCWLDSLVGEALELQQLCFADCLQQEGKVQLLTSLGCTTARASGPLQLDNSIFAVPDLPELQQGFSTATSNLLVYTLQQASGVLGSRSPPQQKWWH